MTQTIHQDFVLHEREGASVGSDTGQVRVLLRSSYVVPRDTFITGDIPLLLSQLSLLSWAEKAADEDRHPPD